MGVYAIKTAGGEQTLQMFTVNLFSDQESNITPKEQIGVGLETVAAQPQQDRIVTWCCMRGLTGSSASWTMAIRLRQGCYS
jgi:hypothetical protein